MDDSEKYHGKFQERLRASQEAVEFVAELMRRRGVEDVVVPELKVAPRRADWREFSDSGDLFVCGERWEVKRMGWNFMGAQDWPFGSRFIVCSKAPYDRAHPKPVLHVRLSKDMTHMANVSVESRPRWYTDKIPDRNFGGRSRSATCARWTTFFSRR